MEIYKTAVCIVRHAAVSPTAHKVWFGKISRAAAV